MKQKTAKGLNRREFLGLSALGLTGLTILPSFVLNGSRIPPSDRVVLGFIGLGRQALSDFSGFAGVPGIQVAACCDVDSMKQLRFKSVSRTGKRQGMWQHVVICMSIMSSCLTAGILMLWQLLPPITGMPFRLFMHVRQEKMFMYKNLLLLQLKKDLKWLRPPGSTKGLCRLGASNARVLNFKRPSKWFSQVP
jgi:hypothetical protein